MCAMPALWRAIHHGTFSERPDVRPTEIITSMGMFDYLRCHYPLPVEGANARLYQTKDLDDMMDLYEIRADGTLWHEEYDEEDRSDPRAEGLWRFSGMITRVNQRWEPLALTGEVRFYDTIRSTTPNGWIEWRASYHKGVLKELHLVTAD